MPNNSKVILALSGGVACYKAVELASRLTQDGFCVLPVMTDSAQNFVGTETLRSLTGNLVTTDLWHQEKKIAHISLLAEDPVAIVIAPATANIIGKIANGIADDILTTTVLAAPKIPKIIVPSMNTQMWENPLLQENISKLKEVEGYFFVEPDYGKMACGTIGKGRYPDNTLIMENFYRYANLQGKLKGKSILIVSGGTCEPIDSVRVISNLSSGKMGRALYHTAIKQGAKVDFVDASQFSVDRLDHAIQEKVANNDILIMAAAISDYTVKRVEGKISSEQLTLNLTKTKDILAGINNGIFKVGFALEEKSKMLANATAKLARKKLNLIVANPLETLGSDQSNAVIINDQQQHFEIQGTKEEVAEKIIEITATEFESFIYKNSVCS